MLVMLTKKHRGRQKTEGKKQKVESRAHQCEIRGKSNHELSTTAPNLRFLFFRVQQTGDVPNEENELQNKQPKNAKRKRRSALVMSEEVR